MKRIFYLVLCVTLFASICLADSTSTTTTTTTAQPTDSAATDPKDDKTYIKSLEQCFGL